MGLQATLILAALVSSLILAWRNIRAANGGSGGAQRLSGLFCASGVADLASVFQPRPGIFPGDAVVLPRFGIHSGSGGHRLDVLLRAWSRSCGRPGRKR